ncbi:hypothetical protein GCM10010358_82070 [Streptomyces minutiscleroticus]|uniref:Uncharacterized protein n=1 Tax=Streptomyces minutiscleroticus TaxID=68238 RepID=A0A918P4E7_9ACTN|nr:hypothetical protein GCM10010358_82070 [Streptomyces minutiscleroticus]
MGGGGERAGVADLGQDAGSGPDRDPGHGGQGWRERVCPQQGGDTGLQGFPALEQDREGFGRAGDDLAGRGGADSRGGLFGQGGGDLAGQGAGTAHPRGGLEHRPRQLLGAGPGQLGRGTEGLQHGQAGWVPQAGPSTRSRAGWTEVSRPRGRLEVRVASWARSSSYPRTMAGSARTLSSTSMLCSRWDMVRAASAMT